MGIRTPQNDARFRKSAAHFDNALRLLDEELAGSGEYIQVKAIGGYALLKHRVRQGDDAATMDIDSVTADYRPRVNEAIAKVASRTGLAPDWLNNYNVMDSPADVENILQARWLRLRTGLHHVDAMVADIPTLTRSKIIAASDAEISGRGQDTRDLFALVRHQGIASADEFRQRYPDPWDEYAEAYEGVERAFRAESSRRRTRSRPSAAPAFTPAPETAPEPEFEM